MKCPVCASTDLVMSERQGIEIDYCPQCRGVWLDRGELDKIIERNSTQPQVTGSVASMPGQPPLQTPPGHVPPAYRRDDDDDDYRKYGNDPYRRKKKKGFLGELFDFD